MTASIDLITEVFVAPVAARTKMALGPGWGWSKGFLSPGGTS
jgi:hypothetical protein